MFLYKREWKTVDDMYKYSSTHTTPLLSNYDAEFWNDYIENYTVYDRLFRRMFKSFRPFMQEPDETIAEITTEFTADVYGHLMLNRKKYEELYRVFVIQDENLPIDNNVDLTETLERETSDTGDITYGEREDETERVSGSRTDTISRSESIGQRIDSEENSIGQQTDTDTKETYAFNSNAFQNDIKNTLQKGAREDEKSITKGSQSNTSGGTDVKGQQTDTDTFTKGSQVDSRDLAGTESYTKTIKGIDGKISMMRAIGQFKDFWTKYDFYEYIFKEICKELLLV